jgi:uncharacterized protein (TIGR03435 family)
MKRMALTLTVFFLTVSTLLPRLMASAQLGFEVATIKLQDPRTLRIAGGSCHGIDTVYPPNTVLVPPLGRCLITFSLSSLITAAYASVIEPGRVLKVAGPAWVDSDFWQVEGKAENTAATREAELKEMLRTLLMERFQLQFHHEMKEVPGFALVVAKGGLKIEEDHGENGEGPSMRGGPTGVIYRKTPLSRFANFLSGPADGPVIDKTGVTGTFSFTFRFPRPSDPDAPSIFTAIQEQVGLRLEPLKVPADFIVIDHVERPTPN